MKLRTYFLTAATAAICLLATHALAQQTPSQNKDTAIAPTRAVQSGPQRQSPNDAKEHLPTLQEALAAETDVWGEAALREPDGPSYEFFSRLLPPLRYVDAEFRHYPIVLSAPFAPSKARLVSNGSAINAAANLGTWHDVGLPIAFLVGDEQRPFGEHVDRLRGPRYVRGHLPIVELSYDEGGATYTQHVFAAVEPSLATHGAVWVRFGLAAGGSGRVTAVIKSKQPVRADAGVLRDEAGRSVIRFDSTWQWDAERTALTAPLAEGRASVLLIFTAPAADSPELARSVSDVSDEAFARHRQACEAAWGDLLGRGAQIETPEPVVNHAWRSLLVGTLMTASGDAMNYSAGNNYARMYAEESSSPIHALLFFGWTGEARRLMGPLLAFGHQQPELEFHNAAFQLQSLARYYWLTRDADFVRRHRPTWRPLVDRIIAGREKDTGLLPRENYCGDIATKVHSLNSNANCWRALRDMAAVLREVGERNESLEQQAAEYRRVILDAVAKSEDRQVEPPFVPVALFGAEKPYETLTATMQGSYWNLMSNYLLRSGVFRSQPEKARWIVDTLQRRGGMCMGMLRFDQHSGLFANTKAVDDLYSLGYVMHLLEQDDADRALVSFYGKLAQGLTRDTFIGAEGTGLVPLDPHGRSMYLPPNAAGNALFLWTLRQLVAQESDADDDGAPDTLRLLFATPRRWTRDGLAIRVNDMPTAFGKVSIYVQSRLSHGEVLAELALPAMVPKQTLLRLRLPDGWRIASAVAGDAPLAADEMGTVDISGRHGKFVIRFKVRQEGDWRGQQ